MVESGYIYTSSYRPSSSVYSVTREIDNVNHFMAYRDAISTYDNEPFFDCYYSINCTSFNGSATLTIETDSLSLLAYICEEAGVLIGGVY